MKDLNYLSIAEESIPKISKGAFLTVQSAKGLNTLTIGASAVGFMWRKPVMIVTVRPSRHSFGIIEAAKDFTVTVPAGDRLEQTKYCGTHSGRDVDKLKECGLKTAPGRHTESPIIQVPGIHYECRILYASAMDSGRLDKEVSAAMYPQADFSTMYYGEILACYETE